MAAEIKTISTWKWVFLFVATGIVDITQFLIDLTGVGIAVSEGAEPFIGGGIIIICEIFGINIITKIKRIASLIGVGLADAITGGIAPFWIVDIWYIYSDVKKEEAAQKAENEAENMMRQRKIAEIKNIDGVRLPENDPQKTPPARPAITDGRREPLRA